MPFESVLNDARQWVQDLRLSLNNLSPVITHFALLSVGVVLGVQAASQGESKSLESGEWAVAVEKSWHWRLPQDAKQLALPRLTTNGRLCRMHKSPLVLELIGKTPIVRGTDIVMLEELAKAAFRREKIQFLDWEKTMAMPICTEPRVRYGVR